MTMGRDTIAATIGTTTVGKEEPGAIRAFSLSGYAAKHTGGGASKAEGLGDHCCDAPPPAHLPPEGRGAPVQVTDGNYERLSGVCPWWDATIAGR